MTTLQSRSMRPCVTGRSGTTISNECITTNSQSVSSKQNFFDGYDKQQPTICSTKLPSLSYFTFHQPDSKINTALMLAELAIQSNLSCPNAFAPNSAESSTDNEYLNFNLNSDNSSQHSSSKDEFGGYQHDIQLCNRTYLSSDFNDQNSTGGWNDHSYNETSNATDFMIKDELVNADDENFINLQSPHHLIPLDDDNATINTKELANEISRELRRYSIPQAVFAQQILSRSQGTLSDLLRNPKPWKKLKAGRETFRKMWQWLQEPEHDRIENLKNAVNKRKSSSSEGLQEDSISEKSKFFSIKEEIIPFNTTLSSSIQPPAHSTQLFTNDDSHSDVNIRKRSRLVFTDIQRRTLQAIFKETKRPSKEMQLTISKQLGLQVSTVSNFFMNARRRSMDKWKDDDEDDEHPSL